MKKRILVLDLDTPCFSVASVCETRSVKVKHEPTGKEKVFKHRTEFKEMLSEKGKLDRLGEYSFTDIQEPEDISHALHSLKHMVERIKNDVEADEAIYCISGDNNFRDNLELPVKYKSNRASMIRPVLLKEVRQYAINKLNPVICNGEEADDFIVYKGYELLAQGHEPIMSSPDKDSLAYSGLLIYNQDKPELGVRRIPALGNLWIDDKNKLRGQGFLWYCTQILIGDSVDGLKPTYLAKKKFGEKSAYALLKDCKSEQEALSVVVSKYKEWYNAPVTYTAWNGKEYTKDWFEMLQMYHKAIRMKETKDDDLDLAKFFERFGLTL